METSTIQPIRTQSAPAFLFAGHYQRYTFETMGEIPALWEKFGPASQSLPGQVGDKYYGISWDTYTKGQYFEYMAAIDVSSKEGMPEGITFLEVPAQSYAVFEHNGSASELSKTIDNIFTHWAAGAGIKERGFPAMMEVYGDDFDPETVSGRIEIWVPLP